MNCIILRLENELGLLRKPIYVCGVIQGHVDKKGRVHPVSGVTTRHLTITTSFTATELRYARKLVRFTKQ